MEAILRCVQLISPMRRAIVLQPVLGAMQFPVERIERRLHPLMEPRHRRLQSVDRRRRTNLSGTGHG